MPLSALSPEKDALSTEEALIEKVRDYMSRQILANAPDNRCSQALSHHLNTTGGLLRARLCLSGALRLSVNRADALILASCVELLHNASLVHDDIQDGDTMRRGKPTVWANFSASTAILVGDMLISAAYHCLKELSRPEIIPDCLAQLHHCISASIHGQYSELETDVTALNGHAFDRYQHVAAYKTGPLFSLSLSLPALSADYSDKIHSIERCMYAFGQLYQMIDDIADHQVDTQRDGACLSFITICQHIDHATPTHSIHSRITRQIQDIDALSRQLPSALQDVVTYYARQITAPIFHAGMT